MSARPRCARRSRRWARSPGWSTGHRGRGRTGGRSARAGEEGGRRQRLRADQPGCGVRRGMRVGRGMLSLRSRRFNVAGRSRASPRRTWKKPKQSSRPVMTIRETEGTGRSVSARGGLTAILVRRDLKERDESKKRTCWKVDIIIGSPRPPIGITALRHGPALPWDPRRGSPLTVPKLRGNNQLPFPANPHGPDSRSQHNDDLARPLHEVSATHCQTPTRPIPECRGTSPSRRRPA